MLVRVNTAALALTLVLASALADDSSGSGSGSGGSGGGPGHVDGSVVVSGSTAGMLASTVTHIAGNLTVVGLGATNASALRWLGALVAVEGVSASRSAPPPSRSSSTGLRASAPTLPTPATVLPRCTSQLW